MPLNRDNHGRCPVLVNSALASGAPPLLSLKLP